jgi:Fur family peroxide stress response transcriptional regulator
MNDIESISAYLQKNNIKPSFQRIKILGYLLENKNHPNVDNIYTELVKEIPTLSRTTVYNTLNLFLKEHIVRCIYTEDNEIRYDFISKNHGHFKCNECNLIYDFPIDIESYNVKDLDDFQIYERNVYFKGICSSCKNKFKNEREN